jgi:hypothetical protein
LPPAENPAVQTCGCCRGLYSKVRRIFSRRVVPAIATVNAPESLSVELLTIVEETKDTKSAS